MRRACMYAILATLAVIALPAAAQAATVTGVKAAIVPIPGFPETGDILGAGADVEIEGKLEGNELPGGLPLQTRRLVLYFPAGTKIDPTGFPTCTVAKLEEVGPEGCPSSPGSLMARSVSLTRSARVKRRVRKAPWKSSSPQVTGSWHTPMPPRRSPRRSSSPRLGNRARPLRVETHVRNPLGRLRPRRAARVRDLYKREGRRRDPQARQDLLLRPRPRKCPKGGFPGKGEVTLEGGQNIVTEVKVPCPKRSLKGHQKKK